MARAPCRTSNMSTAPRCSPPRRKPRSCAPAPRTEPGGTFCVVMAGLVPAISFTKARRCLIRRDARHKAGHDDAGQLAMSLEAFLFQALNGLASASGLFLVAAGLSLIFGVTRIVNIAHGSLYMLGTY